MSKLSTTATVTAVGAIVAFFFFRFGYAGHIHEQEGIVFLDKVKTVFIKVGRSRKSRSDIAHSTDEIAPDEEATAYTKDQGDGQGRNTEVVMGIVGLAISFIISQLFTCSLYISFESIGIFFFFQQWQELFFQCRDAAFIGISVASLISCMIRNA